MSKSKLFSELPIEWELALSPVINSQKFSGLLQKLNNSTPTIFPPKKEIFTAYQHNSISSIKVVILGQDPYHGKNQAHGLSFSVKKGNKQPPSLKNIFKELTSDLGIDAPDNLNGDLSSWSKQGVFLLNTALTVEQSTPNSHKDLGWEEFTDHTIQLISEQNKNVVFVLWGKFAQKKMGLIDTSKHKVIATPHPSPFSARTGFFGSRPFSEINNYLVQTNQNPIDWAIQ